MVSGIDDDGGGGDVVVVVVPGCGSGRLLGVVGVLAAEAGDAAVKGGD